MAYDFVDQAIKGGGKAPQAQSTPAFKAPTPAPIKTSAPKIQSTPAPSASNPHGQIFSGNMLNKAFDVLRLPEYAIASFNKGQENAVQQMKAGGQKLNLGAVVKGVTSGVKNIIPGVANRTQFGREQGDYNAGAYVSKNPLVQTGINFGASLASPSIPVGKVVDKGSKLLAPVIKTVSKIPVVQKGIDLATKVGGAAVDYAKSNPKLVQGIESIPGLEHFRNPEVGKIINTANSAASSRVSGLFNRVSDVAKGLTPEERVQIGHIIEGTAENPAPKLVMRANYIKGISDKIGQELVDNGIMKPETFAKYQGHYLSHIADVVKNTGNPGQSSKAVKFFLNSLKERKDKLGGAGQPDYIREFQFPVFKALAGELHTLESTKGVKEIAGKFGQNVDKFNTSAAGPRMTEDGRVALEDVLPQHVGRMFKNVAVPQEVADYVGRNYSSKAPGFWTNLHNKALDAWKLGKTIYSGPGYHTRNLLSNQILSDMATGVGLPKTLYNYGKAVKAYLGKGDAKMSQYLQEMKDMGVISRMDIGRGTQELKPGVFGQDESKLIKALKAPARFQSASEETAKLNVYSHFRGQGMTPEEAAKKAEEAIFSPYNISKTERGIAKNITPFYSFTRQALPFTAKTAIEKPGRLVKYEKAKTAIEGLSPEGASNNKNLPANMNGEIRLPVKDKQGHYSYFDPTYIYPYGNFGDAGKGLPFGLSFNPFAMEGIQQGFNKDTYFDQPIAKSKIPERANAQRAKHAFQTLAPNMSPTDLVGGIPSGQSDIPIRTRAGDKIISAATNQPDYAGRKRSKIQAMFDTFGLKSAVYRPEDTAKFSGIDKNRDVQDIRKEMRSIMMDQSKTPKQKAQLLKRLQQVQTQRMQQQ